jgi:hypothetical protein
MRGGASYLRNIIGLALLTFISLTVSGQEQDELCAKGPVELKLAGSTWFISIAGGQWQHVGHQWEVVKNLISGTPVEAVYNQRRTLYYVGSTLLAGLGSLFFFWPSQLCVSDPEAGIRCEDGLRLFTSPLLMALGTYWLLKVEEFVHVSAIKDYNEMWRLVCGHPAEG